MTTQDASSEHPQTEQSKQPQGPHEHVQKKGISMHPHLGAQVKLKLKSWTVLRGCLGLLVVVYVLLLLMQFNQQDGISDNHHELLKAKMLSDFTGSSTSSQLAIGINQTLAENESAKLSITNSSVNRTAMMARANLPDKLQTVLDNYYIQHDGQNYDGDLWKISNYVPKWMQEYFEWHRSAMAKLTITNSDQYGFLIMQCIIGQDGHCGGTADRLKSIPTLTRIAKEQNRLLFIHWTLPTRLEEFLLPPQGGFDWRPPQWMEPFIHNKTYGVKIRKLLFINKCNPTIGILRTRYQSVTGGSEDYNSKIAPTGEYSFEDIYHDVWRIFFTPTRPIADAVQTIMDEAGLMPGEYVGAHLRALYGRNALETREVETVLDWTHNGLRCATELRPGGPIYFSSDHNHATDVAPKFGHQNFIKVVTRQHQERPQHLDKPTSEGNAPSEFYDTFIDLYLLGMGKCMSYNRGGFGTWGLLIGYDPMCEINQKTTYHGYATACNWTFTEDSPIQKQKAPLFRKAMEGTVSSSPLTKKSNDIRRKLADTSRKDNLPAWMEDYFQWHAQELDRLDSTRQWNATKYLVLVCHRHYPACGGISDRLKPLPSLVLLAHRHQRLLLIWWTKPCGLEEFLVPPEGGVNWQVPGWLKPHLGPGGRFEKSIHQTVSTLRKKGSEVVVRTRVQAPDAGMEFYSEQPSVDSTYDTVFHSLFRRFFQPSVRLQEKIDAEMNSHDLIVGEYAAAHLRAMYGNRNFRPPNETIDLTVNAINCASQLHAGGPVYFAADIKFAVDVAREYASQRSLPIATFEFNDDPLHLDKDVQWFKRDPSAYDDIFIDLYMLGNSRCVAYSNGGFGTFGQLISYNASCTMRFFKKRATIARCNWLDRDGNSPRLKLPNVTVPEHLLIAPTT